MHMRGTPKTMTNLSDYPEGQELQTIAQELKKQINLALSKVKPNNSHLKPF